jgi:hypothetical protein
MSTNCYQIAYENATNEMTEIDAQIESLTRRKQRLEALLEPLKHLLSESDSAPIPAAVSDDSNTDFEATEADAEAPAVVVLMEVSESEPGPLEAPAPNEKPEVAATEIDATTNSRPIFHEDVAALAYRFWEERGQAHGHHEADWLRAAHELQSSAY